MILKYYISKILQISFRDNGVSEFSAFQIIKLLKSPAVKNHAFQELVLIFHSYLHIKTPVIEKLSKKIKNMNFSKLNHLEIVVSR